MIYTYKQIETMEKYIEKIKQMRLSDHEGKELYDEVSHLDDVISSSIKEYSPNIHWDSAIECYDPYGKKEYNKVAIIGFLEVMDANLQGILNGLDCYPEICSIREDIKRGEDLLKLNEELDYEEKCEDYVRFICMKRQSAFTDEQYYYFTDVGFGKSAKNIVEIIDVLRKYIETLSGYNAASLFKAKQGVQPEPTESRTSSPTIQINNNNQGGNVVANASANVQVNLDISIQIDQTVEQVKDACLSPEQEAAVLSKLEELKAISQEKNTRKRWDKVKGIFKWLAEQSLQVAGWLVPLVCQIVQVV